MEGVSLSSSAMSADDRKHDFNRQPGSRPGRLLGWLTHSNLSTLHFNSVLIAAPIEAYGPLIRRFVIIARCGFGRCITQTESGCTTKSFSIEKHPDCEEGYHQMGDVISIVYTAAIFAALIGFVTFCRRV